MREEPSPKIDAHFRNEVIEECAKSMDAFGQTTMTGEYAANWLRALKSNRK